LLAEVGLGLEDYGEGMRNYRLRSTSGRVSGKVFQEKDIPVQIAVGNYDLGICSLDWVEELQVRYPSTAVTKVGALDFGTGAVYIACGMGGACDPVEEGCLADRQEWRIVSEYPNVAQRVALENRLRRFKIFPVWGAAEAYPPEDADLAVLWGRSGSELRSRGLVPVLKVLPTIAFLIANERSLESKDLSYVLDLLSPKLTTFNSGFRRNKLPINTGFVTSAEEMNGGRVRLGLPDGHQQSHTCKFLKRAQVGIDGYTHGTPRRRPQSEFEWLDVKVIRPQDMPLQVANGNFDLGITGLDWLLDHRYQFPSSPARKVLDLGFGRVRVVAALSRELAADSVGHVRSLIEKGRLSPLRVASEYVNAADNYLWRNHVTPYKLIPTWGASEAFLPDDADLLIDNTETGKTLEMHNLKTIDVLFESTACLIANEESLGVPETRRRIDILVDRFRKGLG
jgi:ATP phosphoribosyltransferase